MLNDGTDITAVGIGALQSYDALFMEYMDGTIMADGHFADAADSRFDNAYTNYPSENCMELRDDALVRDCAYAAVVCEKNLIEDAMMCIDKNEIDNVLTVNVSSLLSFSGILTTFRSAQKCIEYCRGGGQAANDTENKFAIAGSEDCTCATGPLQVDLRETPTDTGTWRWNRHCLKRSVAYTQIGSGTSTVAVYNLDYALRYHGEHIHAPSCWNYLNQFSMPAAGIQRFNLQAEPGAPILTGVDCSATAFHYCEKPLLRNLPTSSFSGGYLNGANRIQYRNKMTTTQMAYFSTALSREWKWIGGTKYNACYFSSKCLISSTIDPVKGMKVENSVYITITFPKVV